MNATEQSIALVGRMETLRLAFEISPVPLMLVAQSGQIVLANEDMLSLFAYEPEQLIGQSVDILVPDAFRGDHPQLRDAYQHFPSKRRMGGGRDLLGVNAFGETVPLELGLESFEVEGERFAMVTAVDIRQRKRNEDRLRKSLDAAACGMILSDTEGAIGFANEAACELLGHSQKALQSLKIEDLVPEMHRLSHGVFRNSFHSAPMPHKMGAGRKVTVLHKDGFEIPVEIALTPVEADGVMHVMSTIIDLRERMHSEQQIFDKRAELEAANHELAQFAYSASHDLKAPLSTLQGLLAICQEDLQDRNLDGLRQDLAKACDIATRSAEKIEAVLRLARAGNDDILVDTIDFDELLSNIWRDQTAAATFNARLERALDEARGYVGEPATLRVIFENLISNAVRFRDEGKDELLVQVVARISQGQLKISVQDNGIGIPEAGLHQVFAVFKRLGDRSGNGIGLALVKKHVARLGGQISFQSKVHEGTTFDVILPVKEGS